MSQPNLDSAKNVGDIIFLGVSISVIAQVISAFVGIAALLWYAWRGYEAWEKRRNISLERRYYERELSEKFNKPHHELKLLPLDDLRRLFYDQK